MCTVWGLGAVGGRQECPVGVGLGEGLGCAGRVSRESMRGLTFSVAGRAGVGSRRLWPHHEEARPLERGLALEAGWEAG